MYINSENIKILQYFKDNNCIISKKVNNVYIPSIKNIDNINKTKIEFGHSFYLDGNIEYYYRTYLQEVNNDTILLHITLPNFVSCINKFISIKKFEFNNIDIDVNNKYVNNGYSNININSYIYKLIISNKPIIDSIPINYIKDKDNLIYISLIYAKRVYDIIATDKDIDANICKVCTEEIEIDLDKNINIIPNCIIEHATDIFYSKSLNPIIIKK